MRPRALRNGSLWRALRRLALLSLVCLCWPANSGHAQEDARELFQRGQQLGERGRWREALDHFERARAIEERPSIVYNIGISQESIGQKKEAVYTFRDFLAMPRSRERTALREDAERRVAAILAQLGQLTLTVSPSTAAVEIDGEVFLDTTRVRTLVVDPGRHTVVVRSEGHETFEEEISFRRGRSVEREVTLTARGGTLVVRTGDADARIEVDGEDAGIGDSTSLVAGGVHVISVSAPGRETVTREVEVSPGSRLVVDITPGEASSGGIARSPIFWTIVGVVVVGGAIGLGLGLRASRQDDCVSTICPPIAALRTP